MAKSHNEMCVSEAVETAKGSQLEKQRSTEWIALFSKDPSRDVFSSSRTKADPPGGILD